MAVKHTPKVWTTAEILRLIDQKNSFYMTDKYDYIEDLKKAIKLADAAAKPQ